MRLLLDVHLAGRSVGRALRAQGHDVLALDEHEDLRVLDDEAVLVLATGEGRVVVTRNIRDFAELARRWNEDARAHAGCICIATSIAGIGETLEAISRALAEQEPARAWSGLLVIVGSADGRSTTPTPDS